MNGEAIYGTRPWVTFGEGPTEVNEGSFTDTKRADFTAQDLRFTCKANALFTIALNRPQGELLIGSMKGGSPVRGEQIQRIELLGQEQTLPWRQDEAGLHVDLPGELPDQPAYTFKIELREE